MNDTNSEATEQNTPTGGCPADGCSGSIERELVGDAANPKTKETCDTCGWEIEMCDGCGEVALLRELNGGAWTERGQIAAQDRQLMYCDECYEEEGYNL